MRSIILPVCLFASLSLAQQQTPKPRPQIVDFTPSDVTADRAKPLEGIYLSPPKTKFDCLIQVRMKMDDKLRESVHEM